jgi:hypothetical protein
MQRVRNDLLNAGSKQIRVGHFFSRGRVHRQKLHLYLKPETHTHCVFLTTYHTEPTKHPFHFTLAIHTWFQGSAINLANSTS